MRRFLSVVYIIIFTVNVSFAFKLRNYDFVLTQDSVWQTTVPSDCESATIEVRAALKKNTEGTGLSRQHWGIVWNYVDASTYNYAVIRCGNSDFGDFLDNRYAVVTIGGIVKGIDSVYVEKRFDKGVDTSTGYNSLLMETDSGKIRIFVGDKTYNYVASVTCGDVYGRIGIMTNERLDVQSFAVDWKQNKIGLLSTVWSETENANDELKNHFENTTDTIEGFWSYLDRENDPKKVRLGGKYRIALVKNDSLPESYDILYVSGAETNANNWRQGMLKGRLSATIFKNHYDVVWYDAMNENMNTESHADILDNAILAIKFPLYNTSIRFFKELK